MIGIERNIKNYPYGKRNQWNPEDLKLRREKSRDEITVLIPTLDRGETKYEKTLRKTIEKTSHLVDVGAIDEILVVDGTGKENNPGIEFDKKIIGWAKENCNKFRNELELIKGNEPKSRKYPISFKILNQNNKTHSEIVGETISRELEEVYKDAVKNVHTGKGMGCWLGIPSSAGDLICFIDSDIKTFEEFYVTNLLMPFFEKKKTNFVKANYIRKNTRGELGGRIKRLVYDPFVNGFSKMGFFKGLETLGYGTSGEFAFKRNLANQLEFGRDYRLETYMNAGVYNANNGNVKKMTQSHLGVFQHLSTDVSEDRERGRDESMEEMAEQIAESWTACAYEVGLELGLKDFMKIYRENVEENIKKTEELVKKSKFVQNYDISYGEKQKELDRKRVDSYLPRIQEGIQRIIDNQGEKLNLLPSWNSVKTAVGDSTYVKLKKKMSEKTTLYTLKLAGLI